MAREALLSANRIITPGVICEANSCVVENSTFKGMIFVNRATMVDGDAYVPSLTNRSPISPSKGARSSVCAIRAFISSMSAFNFSNSVETCSRFPY